MAEGIAEGGSVNVTITIDDSHLKRLMEVLTITKEEYDEWNKDPGKEPPPAVNRVVLARSALGLSLYAGDYVIGWTPQPFECVSCS